MAEQQHKLEVAMGRALEDGTRIRSADGTPILPRWVNNKDGHQVVSNWGWRVRGPNVGPIPNDPTPSNTNGLLARKAAGFSVRLFCGSQCASASAPTRARIAAQAPKQLSNPQIARNALSQALAGRAVVKFLGKVGVLIDEGVDGIIERLMPDGMGMANGPPRAPTLQLLPPGGEDEYELTPEEELEGFRDDYNDALKQYGFYTTTIDSLKQSGANADQYGTPLWLLEQHKKSWGEALDAAGAALKATEEKIKKNP